MAGASCPPTLGTHAPQTFGQNLLAAAEVNAVLYQCIWYSISASCDVFNWTFYCFFLFLIDFYFCQNVGQYITEMF